MMRSNLLEGMFRKGVLAAVLGLASAVPAMAGGGNVLPASAEVRGYSLEDAARATAVFNTGHVAGNPLTPPPPTLPFQILVGDLTVKPGTVLYLPVFEVDDSPPVIPPFPTDITDQDADADYFDGVLFDALGIENLLIEVDGKITDLSDSYMAGTHTPPLLDGGGTDYIVSAAFLSPLTPGKHVVSIGGVIAGQSVVFLTYVVTVK